MSSPSKITNPFIGPAQKRLTKRLGLDTLVGGAGGHDDTTPEATAALVAEQPSDEEASLAMCLDALLECWQGRVELDRPLLDARYETLISMLEVWRDAVPKA